MISITDNDKYLYEMSNLTPRITKQPFNVWVDDAGKNRNVGHNEARFKVEANNIELDIILHKDGRAEFVNTNTRLINKFKYGKEAIKFIEKYSTPLLMQFNLKIDVFQLADIIKLVEKQHYSIEEAIEIIINEE